MFKRYLISVVLLIFVFFPVSAIELVFSATPELTFPFLTGGKDKYDTMGFGGMLDTGLFLFDFLNVGTTEGFYSVPKKNSSELQEDQAKNVFFVPLGLKAGATFFPFSRIALNLGVSGGASLALSGSKMHYQPWYKGEVGAAFRINPSFSVGVSASWMDFQYDSWWENPLMQGINAGVTVTYRYDTKKATGSVSAKQKPTTTYSRFLLQSIKTTALEPFIFPTTKQQKSKMFTYMFVPKVIQLRSLNVEAFRYCASTRRKKSR